MFFIRAPKKVLKFSAIDDEIINPVYANISISSFSKIVFLLLLFSSYDWSIIFWCCMYGREIR